LTDIDAVSGGTGDAVHRGDRFMRGTRYAATGLGEPSACPGTASACPALGRFFGHGPLGSGSEVYQWLTGE